MTDTDVFVPQPELGPAEPAGTAGLELAPAKARALNAIEFARLADVPPEVEWFANIQNPRTRKADQAQNFPYHPIAE